MSLPSLKIAIPVIFAVWCVAGVMFHGPVMLAYPAMWAAVGLLFAGLHIALKPDAESEAFGSGDSSTGSTTSSNGKPKSNERISAAV